MWKIQKEQEVGTSSVFGPNSERGELAPAEIPAGTQDNPLNDADRFALAVTQIVGKRLTYAELTGKELKKPETL